MSKHTWLLKPNARRAGLLLRDYENALEGGATPFQARTFAGYAAERSAQGSHAYTVRTLLNSVVRGKWRLLKGANATHYRACWDNHLELIVRLFL